MVFRLIIVLFFFSVGAFSQEKFIKHSISKGENLTIIAKKYGIKPQDIERANPNAPKTLKLNSVLLIPNTSQKKNAIKTPEVIAAADSETHKILAKETLWGISKKYKISVEDLKKANPFLETEGLKVGQEICIVPNSAPESEKAVEEVVVDTDVVMDRIVLAKETKYAIAREFGITVGELERQNPDIKAKLPLGFTLKIKVSKEKAVALEASKPIIEEKTLTEATPVIVQAGTETNTKKDTTAATYKFQADLADQLISNATENIGVRYRSGGTTKAGFDCSGLMICTFNNFDIKLPRSSIEQSRFGSKINTAEAQKGDLIFFKTNGRRQINHVGMVVEVVEGEIKFVHSSTHGGVMISSTKEPYYQRAFTQVNRVLE